MLTNVLLFLSLYENTRSSPCAGLQPLFYLWSLLVMISPKHACHLFSLLLPNAVSSRGLGGGYHAGECGQGFGKGPEAFRAGWQSGRSPGWSFTVWKLRSQAKEQVLVEELQGEHVTEGPKGTPSFKYASVCGVCGEKNKCDLTSDCLRWCALRWTQFLLWRCCLITR